MKAATIAAIVVVVLLMLAGAGAALWWCLRKGKEKRKKKEKERDQPQPQTQLPEPLPPPLLQYHHHHYHAPPVPSVPPIPPVPSQAPVLPKAEGKRRKAERPSRVPWWWKKEGEGKEEEKKVVPSLPPPIPPVPPVPPVPPSLPPPLSSKDPTLRVVSYNVRIDRDKPPHDWRSRREHVGQLLSALRPSVICLQESTDKVLAFLKRRLPHFRFVSCRRSPRSDEAVPIAFDGRHWSLVRSRTMLLTEGGPKECHRACRGSTAFKGARAQHPRLLTAVELRSREGGRAGGRKEVLVLNTHFPLSLPLQLECARQIADYVRDRAGPVVLCGDLNSHYAPSSAGTPLALLLQAGFRCAHGLRNEPTFGTFSAVDPRTNRLDYVLYRGPLQVKSAVISRHTYSARRLRPSDHSAVCSAFSF